MAILFDWYENPKTKDKQGEELTLHPRIKLNGSTTVSYTHLTLPTILRV